MSSSPISKRQVLIEAGVDSRHSRTEFVEDDLLLPVFLKDSDDESPALGFQSVPILPVTKTSTVDGFGRQAQATYLLEQVYSAVRTRDTSNARVSALKVLDAEVRNLLAITMGEYRGPGPHCGANASSLRQV